MSYVSVYVTCPDKDTARAIARAMLERRLVACANLLPVGSMYWWEGRIEESDEVAMFMKAPAENAARVIEAVAAMHPYDVPCAVAFPLVEGHAPYFDWIGSETA